MKELKQGDRAVVVNGTKKWHNFKKGDEIEFVRIHRDSAYIAQPYQFKRVGESRANWLRLKDFKLIESEQPEPTKSESK